MNSSYSFYYKAPAEIIAESLALFARMTVQPSTAQKIVINDTIKALKNAGIWDLLDVFVLLHSHNTQSTYLNWKANQSNGTPTNSPVFTAFEGTTTASGKYISTNFIPNANTKYQLNNAMYGIYTNSLTGPTASVCMHSVGNNSLVSRMHRKNSASKFQGTINTALVAGNVLLSTEITEFTGLHAMQIDASVGKLFKNGQKQAEQTYAPSGTSNSQFIVGYSDYVTYQSYVIGAALTDQQHADLNNIINAYLTNYKP